MRLSALSKITAVVGLFLVPCGCASTRPGDRRSIEVTIHVAASPAKVWEALTTEPLNSEFWAHEWRFESDWKTGSTVTYYAADGSLYSRGRVIEAAVGRTLAYTWPPPGGETPGDEPEVIRWNLSQSGPGVVRLSMVHERLPDAVAARCAEGWALVLSSLKSLLEVGAPLKYDPK
ncbi:MAG TPA: SRPBCC domain-containing protein [Planctomycetota bacterium]|nr:SRPBCC domain-containing protein [Planctomycetota bacterium]